MTIESDSLAPTLLLLVSTLVVLLVKCRTIVTPFAICIVLFIGETLLTLSPAMALDVHGRNNLGIFESQTLGILLWGSIGLMLASLALRRPSSYDLEGIGVTTVLPRNMLIAMFLALNFVSLLVSFTKLGTFPLLFMSRAGSAGEFYEDVFAGFVTYAAWGASRCLYYWLLIEAAVWPQGVRAFFRKHRFLAVAAGLSLALATLDGQRNTLILACGAAVFLFSLRGQLGIVKILLAAFVGGSFFTLVGNLRMSGADMRDLLADTTGIPGLDRAAAWFVSYLEPNLHNLNNIVALIPQPAMGGIFMSQLVPDAIFGLFADVPTSAVMQLREAKLLAYHGLTFRTAYADWYADFGAFGAVTVVCAIYAVGVWAFNRSSQSPVAMLLYLQVSAVVVYLPLMNVFVGIPMLLPLSLFYLLRFHPPSCRVQPTHEHRGKSYSEFIPEAS